MILAHDRKSNEFKLFDTVGNNTTIGASGDNASLVAIGQGDDINNREGRNIRVKSVQWKVAWQNNTVNAGDLVRTMILLDTTKATSVASVANILSGTPSVNSPLNVSDWPGRFIVLSDQTSKLSNTGDNAVMHKGFKKVNWTIRYGGTSSTAYAFHNLIILFISLQQGANRCAYSYTARVRYTDN